MNEGAKVRRGWVARAADRLRRNGSERGDVPGWVLVTMMTAGLVAGLWAVAGDALGDLFRSAIAGVAP